MGIYCANPEKIMFFGRWENSGTKKICLGDYAKAVLMFKGDYIKIDAKGTLLCSLDGGKDVFANEFKTNYGVHSLYITAMSGDVVYSVDTEELLNVDVYFEEKLQAEYNEIKADRPTRDSSAYKKLEYKAKMPSEGVKLGGAFGELFDRFVKRIKLCATLPYHIAANEGVTDNPKTGWTAWLPAASDGRMLAGLSKAYLWTRDEELRDSLDKLIDKIESQTREDGYSNYYPEEIYGTIYTPHGENTVDALMDSERKNFDRIFWTHGIAAAGKVNKKALDLARRMYDWLESTDYKYTLHYGHNATNALTGHLMLAQTEVGQMKDVIFHQKYLDQRFLEEEFIKRNPLTFSHYPGDRPHCYVLLAVLAAVKEYQLTGDKYYLDVALGGWDVYKRYYIHVGGMTAICETDGPYLPGSYHMAQKHTGETCASVFWVWINTELAQLFPDEPKYSREIEEVLFNIATTVLSPDGGIRYHNFLHNYKDPGRSVSTCCEIMATHLLGDLPKYVFSYADNIVYVNQFISAELETDGFSLSSDADIFDKKRLVLTVTKAPDTKKRLKIRIPDWASEATVAVSGKAPLRVASGSFVELDRVWADGDTVTVTFDTALRTVIYKGAEQFSGSNPKVNGVPRSAFVYGPCLMALVGDYKGAMPGIKGDIPQIKVDVTKLERIANGPSSAYIPVEGNIKLVPYFEIDKERFCPCPAYTPEDK